MKLFTTLLFATLLFSISSCGQSLHQKTEKAYINYNAIKSYPKPTGYVNDFESLLSLKEKNQLDSIIIQFEKQTTNQIVIVTIPEIKPYESLKDFSTDLGNYWGVGQAEKDNGLIILVSKNMRQIWIGTGLGSEEILTNSILETIISTTIVPPFKKGAYFEGIRAGLIACIDNWK
jgi:uncharacterized protein